MHGLQSNPDLALYWFVAGAVSTACVIVLLACAVAWWAIRRADGADAGLGE